MDERDRLRDELLTFTFFPCVVGDRRSVSPSDTCDRLFGHGDSPDEAGRCLEHVFNFRD